MAQATKPTNKKLWPKLGATIIEDDLSIRIETSKFLSTKRLAFVLGLLSLLGFLLFQSYLLIPIIATAAFVLILAIFFIYRSQYPIGPLVSYDKRSDAFSFRSIEKTHKKDEIQRAEVRYFSELHYNRTTLELSFITRQPERRISIFDWKSARDDATGFSPPKQMTELGAEYASMVGISFQTNGIAESIAKNK